MLKLNNLIILNLNLLNQIISNSISDGKFYQKIPAPEAALSSANFMFEEKKNAIIEFERNHFISS